MDLGVLTMANKRQLIDRRTAVKVLERIALQASDRNRRTAVKCLSEVELLPTVDAVVVVRCHDCKHWNHGDCYRLELSRPDDFCSYGEKSGTQPQ